MPDIATPLPSEVTTLRCDLAEILIWLNHWEEDRAHGLPPTNTSLTYVRSLVARVTKGLEHV